MKKIQKGASKLFCELFVNIFLRSISRLTFFRNQHQFFLLFVFLIIHLLPVDIHPLIGGSFMIPGTLISTTNGINIRPFFELSKSFCQFHSLFIVIGVKRWITCAHSIINRLGSINQKKQLPIAYGAALHINLTLRLSVAIYLYSEYRNKFNGGRKEDLY